MKIIVLWTILTTDLYTILLIKFLWNILKPVDITFFKLKNFLRNILELISIIYYILKELL